MFEFPQRSSNTQYPEQCSLHKKSVILSCRYFAICGYQRGLSKYFVPLNPRPPTHREISASMSLLKQKYRSDCTLKWFKHCNTTNMAHLYYQNTIYVNSVITLCFCRTSTLLKHFWCPLNFSAALVLSRIIFSTVKPSYEPIFQTIF